MERRKKTLAAIRHSVTEEALRDSLRTHGQFTAVFKLGGVIVDGRRRDRMLRELGRTPEVVNLRTARDAAQVLWQLHPVHALQEYCADMGLTETAEYLGVSLADVAAVRSETRPREQTRNLGEWRPNYRNRWNSAQRYLARVRQGHEPLTLGGIEKALKLPPVTFRHTKKRGA